MGKTAFRPEIIFKNMGKTYWPDEGYSKGDLVEYYAGIIPFLLPHLLERPITMKRYPDGIKKASFYQKNYPSYAPEWVGKVRVPFTDEDKDLIYVNSGETILWLISLGCIELHSWLSTRYCLERPDIMIFDLDPAPPACFADTLPIAVTIRDILHDLDLECYPKSSGADGLHIYIPIRPEYTYNQVRDALKAFCEAMCGLMPDKVTVKLLKKERKGRIYLDYLQNGFGKTTVSVYSARPEPKAPVSTPLSWDEIEEKTIKPEDFTIKNMLDRVNKRGDLFLPVITNKQNITKFLKFTGQIR